MRETLEVHEPLFVNALGHSAGAVIFAIFLYLLLRDRGGSRLPDSRRAMAATALALTWSLASLAVLLWNSHLLIAISSSALSLLPAVLLDVSLAGNFTWIKRSGYLLSCAAIAAHTVELFGQFPDLHRPALILITIGFGALTILAAALPSISGAVRQGRSAPRLVGTMSLFLFAMSFVHFQSGEVNQTWTLELILHHAGIPLSLFVLLQDYRSVLADALIRFFANILLACAFAAVAVRVMAHFQAPNQGVGEWLYIMGGGLVFVLFAVTRGSFQRLLTKLVFRRGNVAEATRVLKAGPPESSSEEHYLDWVRERVAEFFGASPTAEPSAVLLERLTSLSPQLSTLSSALPEVRDELEQLGVEAIAPLRLAGGDRHSYILLGRRKGGRPYLSEDLDALAILASEASEQLEIFRDAEQRKLISQAELRALQSQIHPHFLFNALNALYGIIPREATGARQTVLNLADIFRYFLRGERSYIALEEEVTIIRAYLEIESLRLGDKLQSEIVIDPEALAVRIPILSIEPLVENAVKHGVAMQQRGGKVKLTASIKDGMLIVMVHDTGPGFTRHESKEGGGVGLENVRRRLELCYGSGSPLNIHHDEHGTEVSFRIPARAAAFEAVR